MLTVRETRLGAGIDAVAPYTDMASGHPWQDQRFAEYRNTGAGAVVTVPANRPQLTPAQAAAHTLGPTSATGGPGHDLRARTARPARRAQGRPDVPARLGHLARPRPRALAPGGPGHGRGLLVVPPEPTTPYDPVHIAGPEGDGYARELVEVSLTRRTRVRGALLTLHGPGPSRRSCCCTTTDPGSTSARRSAYGPGTTTSCWPPPRSGPGATSTGGSPATNSPAAATSCSVSTRSAGANAVRSYTKSSRRSRAPSTIWAPPSPDCTPARTSAPRPSSRGSTGWTPAGSPPPAGPWAATAPGRPPRSATT